MDTLYDVSWCIWRLISYCNMAILSFVSLVILSFLSSFPQSRYSFKLSISLLVIQQIVNRSAFFIVLLGRRSSRARAVVFDSLRPWTRRKELMSAETESREICAFDGRCLESLRFRWFCSPCVNILKPQLYHDNNFKTSHRPVGGLLRRPYSQSA